MGEQSKISPAKFLFNTMTHVTHQFWYMNGCYPLQSTVGRWDSKELTSAKNRRLILRLWSLEKGLDFHFSRC